MSGPFDHASLAAAVAETLAASDIPAGKSNAFVLAATTTGVKGVVSVKIDDHWIVDSVVNVDYHGHLDGGVSVRATW